MIYWMLTRLEKNPAAAFYQKELIARFPDAFLDAQRDRLLKRLPVSLSKPMTLYHHGLPRSYVVFVRPDGVREALDPEDPEADPIELKPDDLAQWMVDLDGLARKYQEVNGLTGHPERLSDQLHFLGESGEDSNRVAFVLGLLYDSSLALIALSALPSLLGGSFARIGVACPTFMPQPTEGNRLDQLGIVVFPLSKDDLFHLPTATEVCLLNRTPQQEGEFEHAPDYSWIKWRGLKYILTPPRAEAVRMLHTAHDKGVPGVRWGEIEKSLNGIGYSYKRMRDVFQDSPLWETLIVTAAWGVFRLNLTQP